ncbi:MAG: mechanosensitive ion channel family protein [Candidatus Sericytochromatia bacterium]|nr:mechanosensitive ion channel family protein [Candidatus Sericytochromatia bacterium]
MPDSPETYAIPLAAARLLGPLAAAWLVDWLLLRPIHAALASRDPVLARRARLRLRVVMGASAGWLALEGLRTILPDDWWPAAFGFWSSLGVPLLIVLAVEAGRTALVDGWLRHRRRLAVPGILDDLGTGLTYLVVGLFFLATVHKVNLTPFLTLSGVVSLVVGLALQDTLGNLFAGLAINLDPPFRIGDWVLVEGDTGEIVEITWRATKLRTTRDEFIILPNNVVAKAKVINYLMPTPTHAHCVVVGVAYEVSPMDVERALLSCAAEMRAIQKDPKPQVFLRDFSDSAMTYELRVWITGFGEANAILSELRSRVWYRFQQLGIEIPWPIRNVYMRDVSARGHAQATDRTGILSGLELFACLSDEELHHLALCSQLVPCHRQETIFSRGDAGDRLYVVASGTVEMHLGKPGRTQPLATLGPGDVFGERALLTGEPRSATAWTSGGCRLVTVAREDLAPLLEARPDLAAQMAAILTSREERMRLAAADPSLNRGNTGPLEPPVSAPDLLGRVRTFFGLA